MEPQADDRPADRSVDGAGVEVLRRAVGRRHSLIESLRSVDRWTLITGAGLVGVAVIVLVASVVPDAPPPEATLPRVQPGASSTAGASTPDPTGPGAPSTAPGVVVVHVAGAVARPGLVRVPPGSRVDDAIAAAGGPTPAAAVDRLNLAQPVEDGARVYVPLPGEQVPAEASPDPGGRSDQPRDVEPVDLNAADVEQLDTLPGVGPATAAAIVEHRRRHGPFDSVEGLLDVRGIGPAKLEQLRPLVTVMP